ncbi:MAG: ATP-binding cassette domain-containing protein [Bacilli bacterium]|nr:ATP-binding cassette domain-containing protein [Bacilli bacterium]
MLKLVDIKKNYIMKNQEPVKALRGVSVNFKQNEFVAVLGPSGCGKTTFLNIIGGLDRYSEGDLIIKNKSTKNYTDYDWDTYRNHSIGFVFQAYNLIGHQTIAKNVELALTIAGVDKKERKERAYAALEKVGLKGMEKKRPNQLSGGQMQRVAIARALVNNPEILLADEPTGALDSETSVQIMDLLKEVAKDRLVIMVTHNPDLAERYATRIVNMFDGVITGDSNPFDGKGEKYDDEEVTNKGKKKKSSMSFLTATSLSIANLFSKSKRTILVAIAGSIGIFGVSTVLAASTGVRRYIDNMQDDMLSSYPLSIAEESVDMSSLMTGLYQDPDSKIAEFDTTTEVGLNSMIDYLMNRYSDFTSVKTNTIDENLVQFVNDIPSQYVSATSFSYGIDPTNNIFTEWKPSDNEETMQISLNGLTQRYIAELKTVEGFSQYASYVDLFTDFMKLLPGEEDYILSQYDLLGDSHFPQNENEIMLVVQNDTTLTDLVFAQLGYYQEEEVMNIAKKAIKKYDPEHTETDAELDEKYPYKTSFKYETLLGKKLTYYPHDTLYHYDDIPVRPYKTYNTVLRNGTNDEFYSLQYSSNVSSSFIKGIVYNGTHIKLDPFNHDTIYAIKMKPSFDPSTIMGGGSSTNFEDLIADPESTDPLESDPSFGKFLSFDLESARALITGSGTPDYTKIGYMEIEKDTDAATVNSLVGAIMGTPGTPYTANKQSKDEMETVTGYQYSATVEDSWTNGTELKIAGILRPKKGVSFGCLSRGVYYTKAFQDKYINDAKESKIIRDEGRGFESFINQGRHNAELYNAYVTFRYTDWTDPDNPVYNTFGYASSLNGDLNSSFGSLLSSITGTNYASENATHFRSLCGLKIVENADDSGVITSREFKKLPERMSIYPVNFETKSQVNKYLDKWNSDETITLSNGTVLTPKDRDELTYTDTISIIITVIDTMITIITTALVIFTSLSLVVSSFMIAVITYISVMERVKEIGVIRSLGGRKKDVSRLFIAENLVTGVMSGIIGLVITEVVCIIINLIIGNFGVPAIAVLTLPIIGIMLALSVVLSVVAGLIPSMHASRQDPVTALRSE